MRRLKVLVSAYACEPDVGSEPGVGWKIARELTNTHEVWVITRSNNRQLIERELSRHPAPGLHFRYFDLPSWARWWKRGQRGVQLYYYLWQVGVYFVARRLCREVGFDVAQHATFVKYWSPSLLALLPVPFVWGPVGGGESTPRAFRCDFGLRGKAYEALRDLARRLGEHDPLVRLSARRSALALATTEQTAARLRVLGAADVRIFSQLGASEKELEKLGRHAAGGQHPARFISVGRLLHWKGFHLGLRAFASAGIPGSEYWIVGDGPEEDRLRILAEALGVADRVTFLGDLSRDEVFARLEACTALLHPSLHDSGAMVCLEAMGAGLPVVCLDLGGPAVQVTRETGFKVPAHDPGQVVKDLAEALRVLAYDRGVRACMGTAARLRVERQLSWDNKREQLGAYLEEVVSRAVVARAAEESRAVAR